ncbi:hypothetical protein EIP91_000595 [Steccherinum ochraceum]|uniref:Uncharacterized protein n=1 Tax=Steccherinum ochraceum TaxID=92696 RepID=A0A4R0RIZ3_9APHY|nr:hypothetical protein EIP91_000595 [Steccherinum ochraceum]
MPGVSKGHRAEAKYNVTLDFPHLGLHAAAATGNIGLVKYALEHGQPINSVLDGVLPLHAACSGGNDLVVRLLIERGADVNAPRLPRRYSNDKNRDASAPIVGTSGSTPLHFACANGHTSVVLTLLLHGAHPDRPDKHGVTPEVLARNNGFNDCADVLRQWSHNKDKDLRDREGPRPSETFSESAEQVSTEKGHRHICARSDCRDCATIRKRLRVKRSIDNAIHMLKPSASHSTSPCPILTPLPSTSTSGADEPPSPAGKPLGEYTFYPTVDAGDEELPPRRPSLPHILDVPRSSTSSRRPSGFSSSSGTSSRRPRSAGTDADQFISTPPKVKSKISLLNIFKKGTGETPESLSASSSALNSASPSPAPDSRSGSIAIASGSYRSNRSTDVLSGTPPDASSGATLAQRFRNRLLSESSGHSPSRLQTVELHPTPSKDSLVTSGEASPSPTSEQQHPIPSATRSPPIRPILRAHGRSSSSGQSASQGAGTPRDRSRVHSPGPSVRALRFDATATSGSTPTASRSERRRHESRSPSGGPRGSTSYSSLRSRSPGSPWGMSFRQDSEGDISIPYTTPPLEYQEKETGNGNIEEEEEEEEYGKPVLPHVGLSNSSTGSSSSDLLSPTQQEGDVPNRMFDCPFSINRLVADDGDASTVEPSSSPRSNLLGIDGIDSRMRGDSLSSMSTNPSAYVVTPALSHMNLPAPSIYSPPHLGAELPEGVEELPEDEEAGMIPLKQPIDSVEEEADSSLDDESQPQSPQQSPARTSSSTTRSSRTSRPGDIDIRSISSHAQAEALVQQAQQRILDLANNPSTEDVNDGSSITSKSLGLELGEGRTPLSARLAAYGESLKIEQKFKEKEERRKSPRAVKTSNESSHSGSGMREARERVTSAQGARGLDRTFSLEERHHVPGPRAGRVRRPHTAGGTPISDTPGITVSRERSPLRSSSSHHQHSLSSAAALSTFEPSAKSSIKLGGGSGTSTPIGGPTSITPPAVLLSPNVPMTKSLSNSRSETLPSAHSHQTHHSHSLSSSLAPLTPLERPRIQRSRTPDPTEDRDFTISPRPVGIPLSRYSTAPHDGFNELGSRGLSKQEREVARANKLTKMGFSVSTGSNTNATGPNGAGETWSGRSGHGHKHRFGGIKTLVQSLTGKS